MQSEGVTTQNWLFWTPASGTGQAGPGPTQEPAEAIQSLCLSAQQASIQRTKTLIKNKTST